MQILEPGEYRTRDGRTVTVSEVKPSGIFRVFGKLDRKDERWTVDGRLFVKHQSSGDICGRII
jgi:hypothetical protein